jgi:hypothetical protein
MPENRQSRSYAKDSTEVERARKLIDESLRGYKIVNVDAQEDKIVYTGGTNHEDFVRLVSLCAGVMI